MRHKLGLLLSARSRPSHTLQETESVCLHRVNEKLAADRAAVLKPDVDTPFENMEDVISRLLPYHILQQPQEDLDQMIGKWKGKRKATELETEIAGGL